MKKFFAVFAVVLVFLFVAACSGGSSKKKDGEDVEINEGDTNEVTPDEDETTAEECDLVDGLNTKFKVGDLERSFILRLPEKMDAGKKFPVIFLYHGYGQDQGVDAASIEPLLKPYVNNETMPFILVVPEARSDVYSLNNFSGLDWDMMNLSDGNAEADMFDAVLACIDKKWGVDEKHIHVTGFSAGAIAANSVALMRPEKVASIISYSGAYFSDEASRDALGELMGMKIGDFFNWPDFAKEHNKYPQIFVFGDKEEDSWGAMGFTIYFNKMARLGANYLTENGHEAILCEHKSGHDVDGIDPKGIVRFFADHPFGEDKSSYRDTMPEDFKICHFFTEADLPEDEENNGDSDDSDLNDDEDIDDSDLNDDETGDSEQGDDGAETDQEGTEDGDQDQEGTEDGDQENDDQDTVPENPIGCSLKEGLNEKLEVGTGDNKLERDFYLRLPEGISQDGKKFPVVFFYHPYSASASDVDPILSGYVNNEVMPFILVVPDAKRDKFKLSMPVPTGLDWDIMNLEDGNAEAEMFDKILGCIGTKADPDHIHLAGFSAGAIAADSVAQMRDEKIASVLTYSGAYFSNDANREALGTITISEGNSIEAGSFFSWPEFELEHNKYTQMLVFGAKGKDVWENDIPKFSIDFNMMGQNDGMYLFEMGHGVIKCNHRGGHEPENVENDAPNLIKFFKNHPRGQEVSPYKEELPTELQDNCVFMK